MSIFSPSTKTVKKAVEAHNIKKLMKLAASQESYAVQIAAIRGLGTVNAAEARPLVQSCLKDPDPEVRLAAIEALGRIGDTDSRTELLEMMRTEQRDYVRQAIAEVLPNLR